MISLSRQPGILEATRRRSETMALEMRERCEKCGVVVPAVSSPHA
jgi:hypothetical protein